MLSTSANRLLDLLGIGGIAGKGAGSGRVAQCGELVGIARRQANAMPSRANSRVERGAEAGTGADDESGLGLR